MVCGACGAAIVQVSGKGGGYYGCLGATKGACENRLLVRRTLAERIVVAALREKLASAENLQYVLKRVEEEVASSYSEVPETIRLKEIELQAEDRRIANFIEFIGEGRGSKALGDALAASERRAAALRTEVELLRRGRDEVFKAPPLAWIEEPVATIQEVLERRTGQSALILRKLLGTVRLEPAKGDIGRPYFRAVSALQVLSLLDAEASGGQSPEAGSTTLHWWTRSQRIRTTAERRPWVAAARNSRCSRTSSGSCSI